MERQARTELPRRTRAYAETFVRIAQEAVEDRRA
jgi:hypothetical protein